MAWKRLCCPLREGGLGIKSLKALNKAALLKLSWDLLVSNKDWVSFLRGRYLQHNKPSLKYVRSSIWPGIKNLVQIAFSNSIWMIGDGKDINFWLHNWSHKPLVDALNIPVSLHNSLSASIADFIKDGKWFFFLRSYCIHSQMQELTCLKSLFQISQLEIN